MHTSKFKSIIDFMRELSALALYEPNLQNSTGVSNSIGSGSNSLSYVANPCGLALLLTRTQNVMGQMRYSHIKHHHDKSILAYM